MSFVNLHIHSNYGYDSTATISAVLKYAADYTALGLKKALQNRTTIPRQGKVLNGDAVLISYMPHLMLRKTGWASWNTSPESPIKYPAIPRYYQRVQCPDLTRV